MQKESVKDRKAKNIGLFLVVVVIGFVLFKGCNYFFNKNSNKAEENTAQQNIVSVNDNFVYTKHAKCRMDCRNISEKEIMEVVREGHINYAKSKQEDGRCPTYAIEDEVADGSHLRVVFAKCENTTKVVTCIDLDKEFKCTCK